MILGASILQLPAIKKAKEMGLDVYVVDMNPDAVGFKEPGIKKFIISTIDIPGVLAIAKHEKIDGVMTLASDMPMQTVATINESMGLQGINLDTAIKATNKAEMRLCLAENNVPIPRFEIVRTLEEYLSASTQFSGCFVSKAADNSGNRGIQLVHLPATREALTNVFNYSREYSRDGRVLLEEYMEGPEFSVESISINGECNVIQITDKITSGAPYFVELGHTQPTAFSDKEKEAIAKVAKAGVQALGIKVGPSHTEIKLTPKGPKIVEIGARLGGGCITTHLVPMSCGVDMVESNIRVALGLTVDLKPKYDKAAAIRFITPQSGVFKGVKGLVDAKQIPGFKEIGFFKEIGDFIPEMKNGLDRLGYVIAQSDTREEAEAVCNNALDLIKIEVE